MKNYILIGLGLTVAGIIAYKFLWKKDEEKSNIKGYDSGTVSAKPILCPCKGVTNNDGFGNQVPLMKSWCCGKA